MKYHTGESFYCRELQYLLERPVYRFQYVGGESKRRGRRVDGIVSVCSGTFFLIIVGLIFCIFLF